MSRRARERVLLPGMKVVVSHLQGEEMGEIESIDRANEKVLVFFNYPSCPHFCSFNLSQVRPIELKSVE